MNTFILIALFLLTDITSADQETVNYLASNLRIEFNIIDNFNLLSHTGEIILTNSGSENIIDLDWSLYFCSANKFETGSIDPDGADLGDTDLRVYHINGCLHKIEPNSTFSGFLAGSILNVPFEAFWVQIQATDTYPNWYFVASDAEPRVAVNTAGEDISWVGKFDTPNQWKRSIDDSYNPYTGPERLAIQNYTDLGFNPKRVIPTPIEEFLDAGGSVDIGTGEWVVVYAHVDLLPEATYLADILGTIAVDADDAPSSHYVALLFGDVIDNEGAIITTNGAYRLDVSVASQIIQITNQDRDGSFYGIQTLLSLYDESSRIASGFVVDYPRYPYRGIHLDTSRNFHDKSRVFRLLDVMAMYKLNIFHFHLTDDEGWRLEIPGIPELTEVGGRRCHDPTEQFCVMPQRGSAPGLVNDGTGFYSVSDYQEILEYAEIRHIKVIPEIDMPGHSHAPITAMMARYNKYVDTNITAATEFLLSDIDDQSDYSSVQNFKNNGMNPCVESTYTFVRHMVYTLKALHADIQPLTTFHFGGDEVAPGAWQDSPACFPISTDRDVLMEYFVHNVAQIVSEEGLALAGWEDGFMDSNVPFNISGLATEEHFAYAWNNNFAWGNGEKAYILANADYKTVLAPSTHFYFDHAYEPDPYDRGSYWATRFTSNFMVFGFMPDDMYENMGVDVDGHPIDKDEICATFGCTPLDPSKQQNIIGIQGHLWSEIARTSAHFDYAYFPRLLSLAERAWHKAAWEDIDDVDARNTQKMEDFGQFANSLGYKELVRLENRGVQFGINPPGARIAEDNTLEAMPEFPGLPMAYSVDGGETWIDYKEGVTMQPGAVLIVTRSPDNSRTSRQVELEVL